MRLGRLLLLSLFYCMCVGSNTYCTLYMILYVLSTCSWYAYTFVWALSYVRRWIVSLLVKILVLSLYLLFIIIYMYVYLRCYLEIYDRTLRYERPSIGYYIANIYICLIICLVNSDDLHGWSLYNLTILPYLVSQLLLSCSYKPVTSV